MDHHTFQLDRPAKLGNRFVQKVLTIRVSRLERCSNTCDFSSDRRAEEKCLGTYRYSTNTSLSELGSLCFLPDHGSSRFGNILIALIGLCSHQVAKEFNSHDKSDSLQIMRVSLQWARISGGWMQRSLRLTIYMRNRFSEDARRCPHMIFCFVGGSWCGWDRIFGLSASSPRAEDRRWWFSGNF